MKAWIKVLAVGFAAVLMCAATCKSLDSAEKIESIENSADTTVSFESLGQTEWYLREVISDFKKGGRALAIDRDELESKGLGTAYTMTINAGRIGGKAAPNTYGAPYTTGEKNALTIQPMVSTMMAPLFELNTLKEQDYFQYLQSAYKWAYAKGQLLIFCKDNAGEELVLAYTQKN